MNSSAERIEPGGELLGALGGDAGVAQRGVGPRFLGLEPLEVDLGEHVAEERELARRVPVERDRARRAPVVALVDRPDAAGPHDLEQAGADQDVDVVGDRSPWPADARSASSVTVIARSSTRSSTVMRSGSPSAFMRSGVSAVISAASS